MDHDGPRILLVVLTHVGVSRVAPRAAAAVPAVVLTHVGVSR